MRKLENIVPHPIVGRGIGLLSFIFRAYMKLDSLVVPMKRCRTVFGMLIDCSGHDLVQKRIRFFNVYEPNLTSYTCLHLKEGDIYVDVGANVGYFSLLAAKCVGDSGKVISVEADPRTFRVLTGNLKLNNCSNVKALNVAATAARCEVSIEAGDPRNSGSNRITFDTGPEKIEGLPLCDILGDDLSRVRFIKIDIEGSEAPILDTILCSLEDMRKDLIVVSELSQSSGKYVDRFIAAGFKAYAIQNVYAFEYYLLRACLRPYAGDQNIGMVSITEYGGSTADYAFERSACQPFHGSKTGGPLSATERA